LQGSGRVQRLIVEAENKNKGKASRVVTRRFDLPDLGIGIGLRTVHYTHIVDAKPTVDWFEILSDNYMHTAGRPLHYLDAVAERYPVALHGVGLSIGSTDPIDRAYLSELHLSATGVVLDGSLITFVGRGWPARIRTISCRFHTRTKRSVTSWIASASFRLPGIAARAREPLDVRRVRWRVDAGMGVSCAVGRRGELRDPARREQRLRLCQNHGFDPLTYLDGYPTIA